MYSILPIEENDIKDIMEKWCFHGIWENRLKVSLKVSSRAATFCSIACQHSYLVACQFIQICKKDLNPNYSDVYNIKVIVYAHMLVSKQITQEEYNNNISHNILENR